MPLLEKVERIAYELMMDQQLPMAAVLREANAAMGIEPSGALPQQAELLLHTMGIEIPAPRPLPQMRINPLALASRNMSVNEPRQNAETVSAAVLSKKEKTPPRSLLADFEDSPDGEVDSGREDVRVEEGDAYMPASGQDSQQQQQEEEEEHTRPEQHPPPLSQPLPPSTQADADAQRPERKTVAPAAVDDCPSERDNAELPDVCWQPAVWTPSIPNTADAGRCTTSASTWVELAARVCPAEPTVRLNPASHGTKVSVRIDLTGPSPIVRAVIHPLRRPPSHDERRVYGAGTQIATTAMSMRYAKGPDGTRGFHGGRRGGGSRVLDGAGE